MEANILAGLKRTKKAPSLTVQTANDSIRETASQNTRIKTSTPSPYHKNNASTVTNKIRTISGMDERVLADLYYSAASSCANQVTSSGSKEEGTKVVAPGKDKPPTKHQSGTANKGRPPLPPKDPRQPEASAALTKERLVVPEGPVVSPPRPSVMARYSFNDNDRNSHARHRSSENLSLVDSTLCNPDVTATIKAVCGVYRVYIVENARKMEHRAPQETQEQSNDLQNQTFVGSFSTPITASVIELFRDDRESDSNKKSIPSIDEMVKFFTLFHESSKMQQDTIIMSLIYLERLMKHTNGALVPTPENWRSLLFSCMILASKVWDDFSMWNVDFSDVSAATGLSNFSLQRINRLEIAILSSLSFDVQVSDSEYAKYYFLIRTMMIRSRSSSGRKTSSKETITIDVNQKKKDGTVDRRVACDNSKKTLEVIADACDIAKKPLPNTFAALAETSPALNGEWIGQTGGFSTVRAMSPLAIRTGQAMWMESPVQRVH